MDEKNLPLIPKSNSSTNHNADSILCDIFQDILSKSKYPESIAKNLVKYNVENDQKKEGANNVMMMNNSALLKMEDISIVEEKIMFRYGKYIMNEKEIKKKPNIQELRLLTRTPLLDNGHKNDIKRYGLIEGVDLFPCKLQKSIDFKINDNPHLCKPCISDLDFIPTKLGSRAKATEKHLKLPTIKNKAIVVPYKLSCDSVVFYNYRTNTLYKKRFKLLNITKTSQYFRLESLPTNDCFRVKLESKVTKISPGMSATFLVTFKSDSYLDMRDMVTINPLTDAPNYEVDLMSYREAPNLCVLIFKNCIPVLNDLEKFDMSRSIALNFDIDCGSCFLGERIQIYLIVKNNGGPGKFFFITEDQWFTRSLDKIYTSNELEAGFFTIQPTYFEMDENDYIIIKIEFFGEEFGLNLEKVFLMCNNITYEKIDIVADTILFDKYCIEFDENDLLHPDNLSKILYKEQDNVEQHIKTLAEMSNVTSTRNTNSTETVVHDPNMHYSFMVSFSATSDAISEYLPMTDSEHILNYLKDIHTSCEEQDSSQAMYSKYLIHFDKCVPYKDSSLIIKIHNNSPLDIKHYWKIDTDMCIIESNPMINKLDKCCVSIMGSYPIYFPRNDTEDIKITLRPNVVESGYYATRIRLYADGIPKTAIYDTHKYTLQNKTVRCGIQCFDVLIAECNILCYIGEVKICIDPEIIVADHELVNGEIHTEEFSVLVNSYVKESMNCEWIVDNPHFIQIVPSSFIIREGENIDMTCIIMNEGYDNIWETAKLVINGIYTKTIIIKAECCYPSVSWAESELDFKILELGNTYSKTMRILNKNNVPIKLQVWESYPMFVEKQNKTQLFIQNLEDGNIEVTYIVDASVETDWYSFLNLYSLYNGKKHLDGICTVTYTVENLCVHIHSEMSQCPILCPDELLFVNHTSVYYLCIHNLNNLELDFKFSKVFGPDSDDSLDIKIYPNHGYLAPNRTYRVDVHLTPLTIGMIDNLYVRCHFKSINPNIKGDYKSCTYLDVIILCAVEDIYVKFTLPKNRAGEQLVIPWPPLMVYDINYEIQDCYEIQPEYEECNDIIEKIVPHPVTPQLLVSEVKLVDIKQNSLLDMGIDKDIVTYLKTIMDEYVCNEEDKSIQSTITTTTTTSSETKLSSDSLKNYFDDDLVLQDNVIEFYGVPLRTAIKKTIIVENMAPINGNISCEIMNFPPEETKKKKLDNILEKMKIKKFDAWNKMLSPDGILIKVDITSKELKPCYNTTIDISVYANTWGIYADELIIEINNIIPFCISILIEVTGLPLEFPITMNGENKTNVFRFGVVPYKSNQVTRRIYIRNTSSVPVIVMWHVYMKSHDHNDKPITLMFDIFHSNVECKVDKKDSVGNLAIAHKKIYGNSVQDIFNLSPVETCIKSQETTAVAVTFNPKLYVSKFKKTKIVAYLVGYVQLQEYYRYQQSAYKRHTGSQMDPCKLKLKVTLELPKLEFEMLYGELGYVISACEVFSNKETIRLEKILIFKNFSKCPATVSMSIAAPLKVDFLKTIEFTTSEECTSVVVKPEQCVEIGISLTLPLKEFGKIAETLYTGLCNPVYMDKLDYKNYVYRFEKYLHIKQKGFLQQSLPIDVTIYFPHLQVVNNIDFELVFIGNIRKSIFTIKNYSVCSVPFNLTTTSDLVIHPCSGVLKACREQPDFVDISVIFIPHEYRIYEETIIITTNVPHYQLEVLVHGIGSHNEKYFAYNQC